MKFVTVNTEFGPVKGCQDSTALGRNVFKFQTIPYMKAPLGKLRFRDAESPEKWTEPFDSTVVRPSYTTYNAFTPTPQVEGKEDAGVLSITTPYIDRNLPVAVYIHGGGFQYAFGENSFYGGDYLLQKDIIFVTINYRVGPIGFLSLSDPKLGIPGNAGLKDQVFALKWIKNNIAQFGGDPNNVTIFGTSAGATSVHHLLVSEQANGLFQRAIPMSGTAFIKGWAMAPKKDFALRLARSLGWDGEGGEAKVLEVLENAKASDLVLNEAKLLTHDEIFSEHILFPFTPIVEPYVTKTTFLPKDPVLLARRAWGNNIDCMIGGTSLEGALMSMFPANYFDLMKAPESFTLAREFSLDMRKSADKEKAAQIGEKIRKLYFGDEALSAEAVYKYYAFAGDIHFWHGIYRAVLSRRNGNGKTFFYRFDIRTDLNFMKIMTQKDYDGAVHGEDISYLFFTAAMGAKPPAIGSYQHDLVKKMVGIVTSFIINGTPKDESWLPLESTSPMKCFNMTKDSFEIVDFPEEQRLKALNEIYEEAGVTLF